MNGFFYRCETIGHGSGTDLDFVAPSSARAVFSRRTAETSEELSLWGDQDGDVIVSQNGGESFLLLSGYVFAASGGIEFSNQAEAASYLHGQFDTDTRDHDPPKLLSELHGSFALVYRNLRRRVLLCVTDRVASRPLWISAVDRGCIVSSHPASIALAVRPRGVNLANVVSLLLYGAPVDPAKSYFQGIDAVPSGSVMKIDLEGRISTSAWYTFHHSPDHGHSLEDWAAFACQRLIAAATRVVKECPEPAIFLSGGVDSRLTTAAVRACGGTPLLVTLGDVVNVEVRIAQKAAAAFGAQHEIILRDKSWYLRGVPAAIFEGGGSYVWTHAHFSRAATEIRTRFGRRTFLLGDFCEAFSKLFSSYVGPTETAANPAGFAADFDRLVLPLYRPQNRQLTLSLLKQAIRRDIEAAVKADIVSRYARLIGRARDPKILGDLFSRWETVASLPTFLMLLDLRSAVAERNLMFDPDVHSLLEILPSVLRDNGNLGPRIVSRLHRAVGRVPNSNSLLPMSWPARVHRLSKLCRPLLGIGRRWILGNPHTTAGSWPNRAVLYRNAPIWRTMLEHLLVDSEWLDPAVFDRDAIRKHWGRFLVGQHSYAEDIERLATIALVSQLNELGLARFMTEQSYMGTA